MRKTTFFLLSAALFFGGIILFSFKLFVLGLIPLSCLFLLYFLNKGYRSSVSLFIFFLLGLLIYQIGSAFMYKLSISQETKVLINRSFLLFILTSTIISLKISGQKIFLYSHLPNWNNQIIMPFHQIKVARFLLFGLIGSCMILLPALFKETSYIKSLFLFGILFALINATLEEVLWRGVMLSSLKRNVSTLYAVLITSVGFGLLHISIGIPVMLSILFSFGGLFYAIVVIKSKSIYPSIVFHMLINLGMVFNGWII
ncbi:CPBP family intramembrane glutamic endopeptidase [Guptibacillus hwajinpoensis]|uniref:CPBP family intramembrane glutamic endopeptidase n=1 Tax=Guptibacillus hwajinpoensis TaxID=208199 RepID=UPI00273AAA83|nr:type II CAAX endopeptidase family protein [Alkalihalobacillus macyae]